MRHTEETEGFAARLRGEMGKKNLSAPKLAEATGISLSTIKTYLHKGLLPRGDKLDALCSVLGCSSDYLLFGTEVEVNQGSTVFLHASHQIEQTLDNLLKTGKTKGDMIGDIVTMLIDLDETSVAVIHSVVSSYAGKISSAVRQQREDEEKES